MSLRYRRPTTPTASPLLEVRSSAGKGQGVFATRDIAVGTTILEDLPTMIIRNDNPTEVDVHLAFLKLRYDHSNSSQPLSHANILSSEPDQDLFRSLHEGSRDFKTRLARIYHENCFENHGSCFICLHVSRVNHSCMPNAVLNGADDLSSEDLMAINPIKQGEEIFICYRMDICESSTFAQRQAFLLSSWHFQCRCPTCSKTGLERELSDARRVLIHTLRWKIKFLEPFPTESLSWLDPEDIASVSDLTDATIDATRVYYDQETTVYNFLLAGLLQAEGLPDQRAAVAWHEAAKSLLDEINCVKENVILLGAASNVRAWMLKVIELSGNEDRATQVQNWETMGKCRNCRSLWPI